ncbi:O-methyltransferase [Geosmithia morbida]|uniref:O-methyltransferase n=1 Tax=Geosmithia morbida TaxID=1094350 RepID=A0A9P5CXP8_9HYPO|nr:O-methyltransferase [Geosmithia morbida]KAF4119523.1 O-methyltransferase [Geosmithia morbida]
MASKGTPVDISVALAPNDADSIPRLVKELQEEVASLATGGDEARHELLLKARTLTQALETPRETMIKHCWGQHNMYIDDHDPDADLMQPQTGALAGLNFGVDTGLWKLMAENGDKPQKVADLAAKIGADPALLARLLRHLGAMGYLKETGVNEYKPTNFTKSLSIPIIGNGYLAMTSCTGAGPLRFHEYSRKRGHKNPSDAKDTAMMYAYNTELDMFAWQQSLGYGTHFNDHMGGYRQGRLPWMDPKFFPVKERLIDGADTAPDAPFLVDIGGSVGHDLAQFKQYHPSHPGKLILQDLPVVIGQISDLDPTIERMGHDFLAEQPVKGARAYYMHSCLHDWPDDVCQTILERIKEAMKPGYSKLLINENVIPDRDAWWETSALDMVMLTLFCSKERTEADWYHLLEELAGLKIVKIWSGGKGVESLIEVERV